MAAVISPELLALLRCPESMQPLRLATAAEVEQLRAAGARTRTGAELPAELEGGLIREDGALLFPIVAGLPVLLLSDAVVISPVAR